MSDERAFPVLYSYEARRLRTDEPKSVPWAMLAPHESQARCNHDQSLARLAERGGLSPQEMLCIMDGQSWAARRGQSEAEAVADLKRRLAEWELKVPA